MAAASIQEGLPPLRGPYADEDWVGYRNGPGHNGVIDAAPDVDPEDPTCRSFYDGQFTGEPVVAEGTMFLADGDGHVVALDATEGTEEWTSDDVGAGGRLSVGYERVFTTGDGSVVALDAADGTPDWQVELGAETTAPTVAYETVFVVADGACYALDVADGSIRWERTDETFAEHPAVSDGRVYVTVANDDSAGNHDLVALDPTTGEDLWRTHRSYNVGEQITASTERVSISYGYDDKSIFDAESGSHVDNALGFDTEAHSEQVYSVSDDYYLNTRFYDDRESWSFLGGSLSLSAPTIAGDTVFVYFGATDDEERKQYEYSLLAFDKNDGTVQWTCEAQEVDEPLFSVYAVATSDAIYVVGDEEIHIVTDDSTDQDGDDPDDGDDTSDDDDSTDGDDTSDDDDSTDGDDGSTPEDTPTPDDPDSGCGCPDDSTSDPDTSPGGESSPTDSATATDEDAPVGTSSESTAQNHQPVENGTATDETDGDGPGLGVVSAITSLGGVGYVLRRRLADGDAVRRDSDT